MSDLVTATGRIRIIMTPAGQAPEEIRRAWIGLVLPCEPILGFSDGFAEYEVVTGKKVPKRYSFHVPQCPAIETLEQVTPEAARWWRDRGYPHTDKWFTFGENEAEIIYGVIRQEIVEVTDEMQGNPFR